MTTIDRPVEPVQAEGVLDRAFQVLQVVRANSRPLSLAFISRETGLPKTTVHRVVQQMLRLGALERHGDMYRIGIQIFMLGAAVPEAILRGVALQRLLELQSQTGHTLHLATMRDDRVVYLEKIGDRHSADIPTWVGGSYAAHATGVGKAMLAFLPAHRLQRVLAEPLERVTTRTVTDPVALTERLKQIHRAGVALDDQEASPQLRCVAHPILHMGEAVAAISISFPSSTSLDRAAVAALRATCTSIGTDLARRSLFDQKSMVSAG